jgi:hypothetical protein
MATTESKIDALMHDVLPNPSELNTFNHDQIVAMKNDLKLSLTPGHCDLVENHEAKQEFEKLASLVAGSIIITAPTIIAQAFARTRGRPLNFGESLLREVVKEKYGKTSKWVNAVFCTVLVLATAYVLDADFNRHPPFLDHVPYGRFMLLLCGFLWAAALRHLAIAPAVTLLMWALDAVSPSVSSASFGLAIVLALGASPWGAYQIAAVRYPLLLALLVILLARGLFHLPIPFCSTIALGVSIPQLMLNIYVKGIYVTLQDYVIVSAASAMKYVRVVMLLMTVCLVLAIFVVQPSREFAAEYLNPRYFSAFSDLLVFDFAQVAIVFFVMVYTITHAGGLDRTLSVAHISFVFRTDKYGIVVVYAGFSLLAELDTLHGQFDLDKLATTSCFAPGSGADVASIFHEYFAVRLMVTTMKVMGIAFVFSPNTTRDVIEHSRAHFIGLVVVAVVSAVEKLYEIGFAATQCYLHPSRFAPVHYDEVLYAHAGTTLIQLLCFVGYQGCSKATEKLRTTRVNQVPSSREFCLNIASVFYETLLLAVTINGVPQMLLASADSQLVAVVPPCVFLVLHMLTVAVHAILPSREDCTAMLQKTCRYLLHRLDRTT